MNTGYLRGKIGSRLEAVKKFSINVAAFALAVCILCPIWLWVVYLADRSRTSLMPLLIISTAAAAAATVIFAFYRGYSLFSPNAHPLYKRLKKRFHLTGQKDFDALDREVTEQIANHTLAVIEGTGKAMDNGIICTEKYILINTALQEHLDLFEANLLQEVIGCEERKQLRHSFTLFYTVQLITETETFYIHMGDYEPLCDAVNRLSCCYHVPCRIEEETHL